MDRKTKNLNVEPLPVGPELPVVPLGPVTEKSLEAEAAALGDAFSEVTAHPADLLADAEEALGGREDLADLVEREYPVTEHLFTRIQLLAQIIAAVVGRTDRADAFSPEETKAADLAREGLLDLREKLARLGAAAGLPASLFSLETKNTQRLNVVMMRMDAVVLDNGAHYRERMPDKKKLDAYVVEARRLIDEQKAARRRARLMRADRSIDTRQQERYERLLLNALQYVSAQGLAAYPDDPSREARYRLDHVYGRKASKAGDPGAGGATPPTA